MLQGRALGMDQILGRMAEEKQKRLQVGIPSNQMLVLLVSTGS